MGAEESSLDEVAMMAHLFTVFYAVVSTCI